MAVTKDPTTVVTISVDKSGNITVSPTSLVVNVGQQVEWTAPGFQAMLLVFHQGNPIDAPLLRARGDSRAAGQAKNRGVFQYQVIVAKLAPGTTEVSLYADTACPTIIIQ